MKVIFKKQTLFILTGILFILGLLSPVDSYAGLSVSYYYGGHHGYSRHHYGGYGYRPYSYYPRYRYTPRRYYAPSRSYQYYPGSSYNAAESNNSNQHHDKSYTDTESTGWKNISQGQSDSALAIFAKEAENNPKAGIPKVGYALAAASSGNLSAGVWAMRRAFRVDPDSLHYLQLDEAGLDLINTIIEKYQYSLNQDDNFLNEAFMVSALNYLKHDYNASDTAVQHAIEKGDESTSVHNLKKLINQQLVNDKTL